MAAQTIVPDTKARQQRIFGSKWLIRECADILIPIL